MGVDLTLMPLLGPDAGRHPVSHSLMDVERRRELWPAIAALPTHEFADGITCFRGRDKDGDPKYGVAVTDPYGERIKFVLAGDLAALKDHEAVADSWQNRAVWAWLSHAPAEWPIALYWH